MRLTRSLAALVYAAFIVGCGSNDNNSQPASTATHDELVAFYHELRRTAAALCREEAIQRTAAREGVTPIDTLVPQFEQKYQLKAGLYNQVAKALRDTGNLPRSAPSVSRMKQRQRSLGNCREKTTDGPPIPNGS